MYFGQRRRERHVGQVVDLDLVVQRERVVALAPVVADALVLVDDERVDADLPEPGRDGQTRLAAADDQHRRLAVRRRPGSWCAGPASCRRRSCASRPPRSAGACRSFPRSPSAPRARSSRTQACEGLSAGSRTTPLPRPTAVSNSKSASITSMPSRRTRRGGVRPSAMAKPRAPVAPWASHKASAICRRRDAA